MTDADRTSSPTTIEDSTSASRPLLTIDQLCTYFHTDVGIVRAVDGVSLQAPRGKTLAIVGESGSGKSVTAFSILQLIQKPGRIESGSITLHGNGQGDVVLTDLKPDSRAMRRIRGNRIAIIFQEPMSSFSPVHTIGSQIAEAVRLHESCRASRAKQRAIQMMDRVGIPDAARRFRQYPHEMSGGLRQRAMIAMALSCRPELIIADEPTTALDVTIQAQILDLMRELQRDLGMSIILITHDLGVVAEMAEEVAVMYLGRVVEQAHVKTIFRQPLHPYTRALLRSIPSMQTQRKAKLEVIHGSVPDPLAIPDGCPFHPRCADAEPGRCDRGQRPTLVQVSSAHKHACVLASDRKEASDA